jgi:hypothetical protein
MGHAHMVRYVRNISLLFDQRHYLLQFVPYKSRKRHMGTQENAFFRLIQAPPYESLFKTWTEQQLTILAPPDDHVHYVSRNYGTSQMLAFVKGHVLKESPFFIGQFVSEADKAVMEVQATEKSIGKEKMNQLFRKGSSNNLLDEKKIRYLKTLKGLNCLMHINPQNC